MAVDYNKTLNLPQTGFDMRANLTKKEPAMLADWKAANLNGQVLSHNAGKPRFVLHDGPPYANGDIHLGTAMNKVLKDIIVRHKNMSGWQSPYVPGWDTHGLPIELKALEKSGKERSAVSALELRALCRDYALQYRNLQGESFQRLGVLGDFDNPYLTLQPEFEARQVEVFGEMMRKGYIYRGLKSVYWCPEDKTALAEAEIEYSDDAVNTVYVSFPVVQDNGALAKLGAPLDKTSFLIWTTTTWTLPANVAIALGADFEYALVKTSERYYVIAKERIAHTLERAGIGEYEVLGTVQGRELEGILTKHPFQPRNSLVILGEHVTLESGTGAVHIAPGHGAEDFDLIVKHYPQLPVIVPVDDAGVLTEEAGPFAGLKTKAANKVIEKYLKENGYLFATEFTTHQYPHCWRCHNPIIFRATEQWFCSVEDFKDATVEAIHKVEWTPAWGENRMEGMVRDRSDWCISRQRSWGVPIPIFYCEDCGEPFADQHTIQAVSDLFRKEGSDAWFKYSAEEILPADTKCPKCGGSHFRKETDIMDVWFDSGSSHAAVLDQRPELTWPCDLYLEGGDQFRGWFQSSLLTAVAWRGEAPYKGVLSHGWVVDGNGNKMSKSKGNGILAEEIIEQYGADILRLWVASSDYQEDVRVSPEILKQTSEAYRKIRNTARFMLGNLGDFDPAKDWVPMERRTELDRWAMQRLYEVNESALAAYDEYAFHVVSHGLHHFCTVDMSNFYLDVIKDRLYVSAKTDPLRRAAQSTLFDILVQLTKLFTPILCYTAQEIWQHIPAFAGKQPYVAMEDMVLKDYEKENGASKAKWDKLIAIRDDVKKALEEARAQKQIGSSLDAQVVLHANGDLYHFAKENGTLLTELCIVSALAVQNTPAEGALKGEVEGLGVLVKPAEGEKCERCWMYTEDQGSVADHPTLCKRCGEIMAHV